MVNLRRACVHCRDYLDVSGYAVLEHDPETNYILAWEARFRAARGYPISVPPAQGHFPCKKMGLETDGMLYAGICIIA